MQFIDLNRQQQRIRDQIESNIIKILNHGKYILGPEVFELEKQLGEFTGIKHAIACSSGTDALLLALLAYNIGHGDIVITTPFTFIATAEVISLLGARPVFSDIDSQTFNIDPEKLEQTIQNLIKNEKKPKAIIPVDIFGLPADYNSIHDIAKKYNLYVIEDAAQSFGAQYFDKRACSLCEITCTSFFPAKPLGGYGDGGMIFTNKDELNDCIRSILVHGQGENKYQNVRTGINARLDSLQAAVLLPKFSIFPDELELREKTANSYNELLKNSSLITQLIPDGYKSAWAQYSILASNENERKKILDSLTKNNIPSAIYYPIPLHLQKVFKTLDYKEGDFPICEDISKRVFSIPMHPYLTIEEQKQIVDIIIESL